MRILGEKIVDKIILLTFDYEMFFHKIGTVQRCLIEPVEELETVLKLANVKATFFVDVLYLIYLLKAGELDKRQYDLIKKQLQVLVANGHRVELHLHPHWIHGVLNQDTNIWEGPYKYRLHEFCESEIIKMFEDGKYLLESILQEVDSKYSLIAYRAGGWCIQPFNKLKKAFDKTGILIDSSVAFGMHDKSKTHYYDFRLAPQKGWYNFDEDVINENIKGKFTEIPISTFITNPLEKIEKRIIFQKNKQKIVFFGDGSGIEVSKEALMKKLFQRHSMYTIDGVFNETLCLQNIEKSKLDLLTFISHPKNLSSISLNFLKNLMEGEYEFQTMCQYYKGIKKKVENV